MRTLPSALARLALSLLLLLLSLFSSAQVLLPESGVDNEGTVLSGSVASLYAVDGNAYVKSTTTEAGSGNQVASFTGAFRIPAGTPSALLYAAVSTNLAGCLFQVYLTNASGANIAGGQAAPSGNAGTVEIAISGSLLAQYRDPASGLTQIVLRMYRPPSAGSGTVTWSTDQMAVLLPILPDSGQEYEGTYQSGSLASLFAVDANAYVKTTQIEGSTNNQVASFATTFKIPDGTTSAILHAVSAASLDGSRLQAYTIVASPNDAVILGGAPLASAMLPFDFPLTATDLARRNATTGELAIDLRTFRPPSAGTGAVTWSTDQLVMYAEPAPGPAMPTGLTATAISTYEIDLSWTDNANNETGYLIERKTGANGTYAQIGTAPANAVTYQDASGLSASTTYVYHVRATNSSGNSPYSNEASATTLPPPPPYLKSLVVNSDLVIGGGTTVAVVSLSSVATSPTVVSLSTSSSAISAPSSVTIPTGQQTASIMVTAPSPSTVQVAYLYAKTASWEQKAKVVCASSLSQVGSMSLTAQSGNGGVWLSWSGPEEDVFGNSAKGYRVYRQTGNGPFVDFGQDLGAEQSYIDSSATPGVAYTYRVCLVDSTNSPVLSSQDVSSSAGSGTSALSWQSPPTGTVQGTINLQLSNATDEEDFTVYVDGALFGVATSANIRGGFATTVIADIDTTTLANGQHSIQVGSASDDDNDDLYTSNVLIITISNPINQTYNDGTTMIEDNEHCEITAKVPPGAYTLNLTDQSGTLVRSWAGSGPDVRVSWDGNDSSGNQVKDGEFDLDIHTGNPSTHYYSKVQGNSYKPKFLALMTIPSDYYPEQQVAYANHIRANLDRLSQSGSYLASRYLVMTITEGTPVAKTWGSKIRRWMKSTTEGLLVDGHGARPLLGHTRHSVFFGNIRIRNYPGTSSKTNIYVPTLLNGRRYRFVYLDTCHSLGGNRKASPRDPFNMGGSSGTYMTIQPHTQWATAFNIDLNNGVFIGNNGQSPYNGPGNPASSYAAAWRMYRYTFWDNLGGSVQDTLYTALDSIPSVAPDPTPLSQWTYNGNIYYNTRCFGNYSF